MTRKFLLFLLLFVGQAQAAPVSRAVTINANVAGAGLTIPSTFLGFSVEAADLINGYYQGTTGNAASFINLVKLLGVNGVFRVGGLTADQATPPALTQNIANNLQGFLAGIGAGWTNPVLYTLDLVAANSATAATQAGFIATSFGASNVVFDFGNEPFTAGNWSFGAVGVYQGVWNGYYTAVTGAVAGAKYCAWDDGDIQDAQVIISGLTPNLSGLTSVTTHYYYFDAFHTGITPAALLSSFPASGIGVANGYAGSKLRMTETNSVASSGLPGISDRLVSAAWFLNEGILLASSGWQGVNIHNHYISAQVTLPGTYDPVVQLGNNNFGPGSIFYGMFLFSKIVGQQIVPSSSGGNGNVVSLATKGSGGNANILAVNNDVYSPVSVKPAQSAAWSTATVFLMRDGDGNGCTSAAPIVGGQAIGESGVWSGASFSINNGDSVSVPACSAALIQIQP